MKRRQPETFKQNPSAHGYGRQGEKHCRWTFATVRYAFEIQIIFAVKFCWLAFSFLPFDGSIPSIEVAYKGMQEKYYH